MSIKLSIIVPAYNEALRIGRFLDAYLPYYAARYGNDVEFIVVINGTTDDTQQIVESYCERYPQLKIKIEPRPVGKGGAVMQGMQAARGEWIGYVDADGATPPEAFDDLVKHRDKAPVVIASRWCAGAVVEPAQSLVRRITSRAFNLLTKVLFGFRLTDTQCGAKIFSRQVVQAILEQGGTITQWAFDVDLLLQAKRAGFRILEIPTTWRDVEGSKIVVTESSLEMLAAMIRLRLVYSPFNWVVSLYNRTLGRNHGAPSDRLIRHSLLLAMGSQVSNGANLLFQIVMAHILVGEDAIEYGVLAAMLGTIRLISIPLGAIGRSMSHSVALACKENRRGEVSGMVRIVTRDLVLIAFVPMLGALLFARQLAEGFHLDSSLPVIVVVLTIAVRILMPVYQGALAGIQAFRSAAALGALRSVLRVVAATLLVFAGLGATGALGGNALGMLGSLLIAGWLLHHMLPVRTGCAARPSGFYRSAFLYSLAMGGLGLLTMSDVVIVKRFFNPDEAGNYALAAMVARIVFFLPLPIGAAMFPKVVSRSGIFTKEANKTFRKGLIMTAVCLLVPALLLQLFPAFFVHLLTGASGENIVPMVRLLVIAYLPLPLITLIANYELAQGRTIRMATCLLVTAGVFLLTAKFTQGGVARVPILLGISSYGLTIWIGMLRLIKCGRLPLCQKNKL